MKECKEFDLEGYIETRQREIDEALDRYLPAEDVYPESLHRAMRYSVFSGGKRFRPILAMAGFGACGGQGPQILPIACAVELVHTYSLIHDDLPCMDDDDLRRGKPTNHKMFGEATAVLAGDALLTFAVQLIVTEGTEYLGCERTVRVLEDLMRSVGTDGMVAGQVVDMESEGRDVDETTVQYIHTRKTASLIAGSVRCGARVAGAGESLVERLDAYGHNIGFAFQIIDDVLDAEGRFGNLKAAGGLDRKKQKATYPAVAGIERSKRMARHLVDGAKDAVADLGDCALPLLALAELVIDRTS
jgi:geranylgeranyl diphosphate synthase type II